jgi:hypothetical protein
MCSACGAQHHALRSNFGSLAIFAGRSPKMRRGGTSVGSGVWPSAIYHEMNDCRWYAADQKAKYDDDDRFREWPPH